MKDFYWDIRPKPEFGTIELRVCDTPLTVDKAAALACYLQSLARWLREERPVRAGRGRLPRLHLQPLPGVPLRPGRRDRRSEDQAAPQAARRHPAHARAHRRARARPARARREQPDPRQPVRRQRRRLAARAPRAGAAVVVGGRAGGDPLGRVVRAGPASGDRAPLARLGDKARHPRRRVADMEREPALAQRHVAGGDAVEAAQVLGPRLVDEVLDVAARVGRRRAAAPRRARPGAAGARRLSCITARNSAARAGSMRYSIVTSTGPSSGVDRPRRCGGLPRRASGVRSSSALPSSSKRAPATSSATVPTAAAMHQARVHVGERWPPGPTAPRRARCRPSSPSGRSTCRARAPSRAAPSGPTPSASWPP